ncbi:50S ribosomal protein L14 [Candidatus Jorgensenbacteria bacterium GWA1_49_17]|uniref:Large ribosomal subunit protein uL14 n=2 Tax=Candidatus Joergenseniibacteriota TaxID=1752739 RepID=A0A1F6BQ01_9BACT|nr:MAG: 50S ribosomal protein L14 [Candidatus Jorgensenbacteria bacterium GWC1_48_12]OGG39981.1 MAG: 50S ribosomal protein L14 [Candidatus Jorgensenbacteria bacterium GWA1_49_17]
MIQERSILKVADNSGAKTVRCFRVLGGSRRRYAGVGDIIIASVQVAEPRKSTIKKKDIIRAVVVRTHAPIRRSDGSYVRFDDNAVVIVDKKEPKATRVFGPIPREIKEKGYDTIASLAEELV